MGAVETDIELSAAGGDAAAAEVRKASSALEGLGGSSDKLRGRFQERFQHIGLQLFAGDALRASGLGRETRAVISTLNLALQEGAAVAGISSGGIMLVVAALGALAGIVVKVIEHHKKMGEETERALQEDDKHLKTIREKIGELEKYEVAAGSLNKVQEDYLKTLREIGAEEAKKKNDDLIARIASLNLAIEKERDHLQQIDVMKSLIKGTTTAYGESTKAVAEHEKKMDDLTMKLREAEVEMNALHKTGTGTFKDMAKDAEDAAKRTQDAQKRTDDFIRYQNHLAYKNWQDDINSTVAANEAALKRVNAAQEKSDKALYEDAKKTADLISGTFGNAFGRALVEGTSFSEAMKNAFKQMAERMISDIIRVLIEWTILNAATGGRAQAVMGMFGGGGGILGHATGGDVMVDKPTLFLAGEGGPEMASFRPLSSMGAPGAGSPATSGGGGGDVYINIENNVTGAQDPTRFADQVGRRIIEQIRGAGQLSFARA